MHRFACRLHFPLSPPILSFSMSECSIVYLEPWSDAPCIMSHVSKSSIYSLREPFVNTVNALAFQVFWCTAILARRLCTSHNGGEINHPQQISAHLEFWQYIAPKEQWVIGVDCKLATCCQHVAVSVGWTLFLASKNTTFLAKVSHPGLFVRLFVLFGWSCILSYVDEYHIISKPKTGF